MAKLGFGTYRLTDTNPAHIDALIVAIQNGITFIDTAINFTNGAAHRAIAKALQKTLAKNSVKIVSKFGYIQGRVLERLALNKELFDKVSNSMVELSQDNFYSIQKDFVHDQLALALAELAVESLEAFLINSPENLLIAYQQQGLSKEESLESFYDALFDAFVALEEEVKKGKIKKYGISSFSLSVEKDESIYFDYEKLLEIAYEAARKIGLDKHHFQMIELPINITQKKGLLSSYWAKENNIEVVAMMPLSGVYNQKQIRLAEYEENRDYFFYLNELLDFCDNELLETLYNLINSMDERTHRFKTLGEYDGFVHMEVLPHIRHVAETLDNDTKEKLLYLLEMFLPAHREMVAYEVSKGTKQLLAPLLKECQEPLQICALEYLLAQDSIDYVVVGARRVRYVYDLLTLLEKQKNK